MSPEELIRKARSVLGSRDLHGGDAGDVAAAVLSKGGNVYLGVCIDVGSGMGFCAEHSAIAAMITAGETEIDAVVAVWGDNTILPPCGRCREFMNQTHKNNIDGTTVILGADSTVKLRELLPQPYQEVWKD